VATTPPATTVPVSADIFLKYTDDRSLDVYYPSDGSGGPLVVMLHGAGGGKQDLEGLARAVAARGAVVVNAQWTSFAEPPDVGGELGCLMEFVQARAAEYGADGSALVLVGHSAGANVASVVAVGGPRAPLYGVCEPEPVEPAGFVGLAGDYFPLDDSVDPEALTEFGVTYRALWELASPYAYLEPNSRLVVRLVHGEFDDISAMERSSQFRDALESAGYDVRLDIVAGGHVGLITTDSDPFLTSLQAVLQAAGLD
jgi:predicted esterase